jgi:hypothetical protein
VNLAVQVFRVRVDAPQNWSSVDVYPVVAEALADRAGFFRREREVLRELDRVAVVMEDHLGVLGVVDAALAEAKLVLRMIGGEGVVEPPLVDPDRLRPVVDAGASTPSVARREGLALAFRLGE